MERLLRRLILCLCVCGILMAAFISFADADQIPQLRVLLRRLSITDRIVLKLEGAYELKDGNGTNALLPDQSMLTVELRSNHLTVFYADASFLAGNTLMLTRQDDKKETHGLFINGSAGLYPGDLMLTVSDEKIQPVLSLNVEDYLLGVVPYEMSDSFPLEALKAQAVCARTYAMRRMGRSGSWDVVDTTNDQVFKGVISSNQNTRLAVDETRGIVIAKDGQLAEGYYAASNGGQTDLPSNVWGGENFTRCYTIQDDPWDIANPSSITRSFSFRKDGTGMYRRITALIRDAVFNDPAWKKENYYQAESGFRIDSFTDVHVKTPRFPSPSRLMTELEITLTASGRKVSGGTLGNFVPAGTFTITLQIFPDVMNALGLSIGSSQNELLTVTETDHDFVLTSARFGHGVGLSQRGAQQMAGHDGMTFDQILAFYFPGSELLKYSGETMPLPVPSSDLLVTLAPPKAEATPRPTLMPVTDTNLPEGAYLAEVSHIDDDSSLNLRQDPSPVAGIIMRLYKHQRLVVLDEMDVPGWAHVKTDSVEGYVMSSYLERVDH